MRGLFAVIMLDLKRLWVDRVRLVSSLIQPLLYLFVLGSGLGASSKMGGSGYLHYIYPGVLGLSLLFSSVFAAMLIVFDRQIGFLKAVLVAPVPRVAIALGKVLSGAIQALVPATILLLLLPLLGMDLSLLALLELIGTMILAAVTFSALGVATAARFRSTTVFPIISNAVLLPMFFLSGALYPLDSAPVWLRWLAHIDPVAYAVDLMRGAILDRYAYPPLLSLAVLLGFIIVLTWLATRVFAAGEDT
ncbi:MAG: ABC transporter permease [Metallibacterium scheffleri]|jgi:ABC-2 type transport system permease protein|uniref:ABC transporter permease n=1 Tax=Metallibacterium scheffleri TaxID=993689 RepID=UPI0026EE3100|nr:ABC transporter permease [Metallibacterium scheffleri]MCK9367658.1 ABC transporter permease [Metallibacterium scheffleri]